MPTVPDIHRRGTRADQGLASPPFTVGTLWFVTDEDVTERWDGATWETYSGAASAGGTVTTTGSPASGNLTAFSGASSITSGNLSGDVTTAGTMATTIANSAVTLAKIANAAANSKLLGSGASGSGAAYSELTLGTNLSMSGTTLNATGGGGTPGGSDKDVQYNNAGAFGGITPGAAGTVLTSGGAGVTPTFAAAGGGGSCVLLEQHTASSSASLDFTTFISSTYDTYVFELLNVLPATSTADLWMRVGTGGGPTWDTGANYTWAYLQYSQIPNGANLGNAGDTKMKIGNSLINTATKGASGRVELFSPQSTSVHKQFIGHLSITDSSGNYVGAQIGSLYAATTALTGVQVLFSSGNIASGTIRVYGLSK